MNKTKRQTKGNTHREISGFLSRLTTGGGPSSSGYGNGPLGGGLAPVNIVPAGGITPGAPVGNAGSGVFGGNGGGLPLPVTVEVVGL